jgi:hypothetical protein
VLEEQSCPTPTLQKEVANALRYVRTEYTSETVRLTPGPDCWDWEQSSEGVA